MRKVPKQSGELPWWVYLIIAFGIMGAVCWMAWK